MEIKKALIMNNFSAAGKEDVLRALASKMVQAGYVKDSFEEAIVCREEKFATGLQFKTLGIAIPHTDPEHVLEPAVSVTRLEKSIEFEHMGLGGIVKVELIFMLALKDATGHIQGLKKLADLFQDEQVVNEFRAAKSDDDLVEIVGKWFSLS
ncbi:PTS sugar transporter subunit IIA [Gottschalkiaceae bacterium SANA]|nr:PTS sugar transporter subunit IIA [Gottschalkiaceae bacterium SANA]